MNEEKQMSHHLDWQDHIKVHQEHVPFYKKMHHSWIFWVFVFLMFAGITYYIITIEFSSVPHIESSTDLENDTTP